MYRRAAQLLTSCPVLIPLLLMSLAAAANADDLFVGDNAGKVDRYNGTTGAFINTLASVGLPRGIVVGADGTLYVANDNTNLIDEYNTNTGSLLGTINTGYQPSGLAFGPGDTLYVTSYNNGQPPGYISKVNLNTGTSTLFANLGSANGIAVAADGDVYAASFGGDSLNHYNAAGTLLGSVGLGYTVGYGVTIGKDGFVYAVGTTFNGSAQILRIDPNTLAASLFASSKSPLLGITTGPDGNLYASTATGVNEYSGTTGAFITNLITAGSGGLQTPVYLAFSSPAGVPETSSAAILVLCLVCCGVVMRQRPQLRIRSRRQRKEDRTFRTCWLNHGLCGILLLSLANVARAQSGPNLLANPSFEQPALAPGTYADVTPTGWGLQSGIPTIITQGYTGGGVLWPHPTDGSQFLYVGDNLTATNLYQDVSLAAATHYQLTFDEANFLSQTNPSGARLTVDILTAGQSILTNPAVFTRPEGSGFATQELDFTSVGAGTYRLTLSQPGGYGTNVDNFSLRVNTTASVPEANILETILFGSGLGLGSVCYRRRRAGGVRPGHNDADIDRRRLAVTP